MGTKLANIKADYGILFTDVQGMLGDYKVMTYHRKAIDSPTNFSVVDSASGAQPDRLNLVNCNEEDVKVDFGMPTQESGQAAFQALECAVKEYREGKIDVLVTAPINKKTIHSEAFHFPGHTEYIEAQLGADVVDGDAIVEDVSFFHIVESVDEVDDGGLAGSCAPYEGDFLSGRCVDVDIEKHLLFGHITEINMLEVNITFYLPRLLVTLISIVI